MSGEPCIPNTKVTVSSLSFQVLCVKGCYLFQCTLQGLYFTGFTEGVPEELSSKTSRKHIQAKSLEMRASQNRFLQKKWYDVWCSSQNMVQANECWKQQLAPIEWKILNCVSGFSITVTVCGFWGYLTGAFCVFHCEKPLSHKKQHSSTETSDRKTSRIGRLLLVDTATQQLRLGSVVSIIFYFQ